VTSPKFGSCGDYANYLKTHFVAESKWTLDAIPTDDGAGTYTVTYQISDVAYVDDPKPTWPHMTNEEKDALATMLANNSVHEHGHLTVAADYIRLQPTEQFSSAGTTAQAQRKMNQLTRKYKSALDAKEKQYDTVTEHGKYQTRGPLYGFPGGDDVVLKCP
jgi:hypothetical protein